MLLLILFVSRGPGKLTMLFRTDSAYDNSRQEQNGSL